LSEEEAKSASSKVLLFVAVMAAVTLAVFAADVEKAWPVRPVRVIAPVAAGGAVDAAARLYADGLSKRWASRSSSRTGRAQRPTSAPQP
jgi:tripartite-type tricarboxylate transporter receptor subunit TctC